MKGCFSPVGDAQCLYGFLEKKQELLVSRKSGLLGEETSMNNEGTWLGCEGLGGVVLHETRSMAATD